MKNLLTILKKAGAYGERLQPTRDWFILLGFTFLLFILGIGWNIFLFNQFENGKASVTTATTTSQQNVGNAIAQIQALYQKQAAEDANYQHTYQFVDPSLPGS